MMLYYKANCLEIFLASVAADIRIHRHISHICSQKAVSLDGSSRFLVEIVSDVCTRMFDSALGIDMFSRPIMGNEFA
jgi:hypothetical protein